MFVCIVNQRKADSTTATIHYRNVHAGTIQNAALLENETKCICVTTHTLSLLYQTREFYIQKTQKVSRRLIFRFYHYCFIGYESKKII